MALVNDVSNLLRLVDRAAGKALTCLTKDDATAAAAAATAAAVTCTSGSSGEQQQSEAAAAAAMNPELQNKLTNMTARPPFAVGPSWHVLTIPVHPDILPVYVLGNDISDAAVTRGLNSLVSSSTLKLLARSPAALAAALQDHLQQAGCRPAAADSCRAAAAGTVTSTISRSSSSSIMSEDTVISSFCSSERLDGTSSLSSLLLREEDTPGSPFAAADLQQQLSDDGGDSSSSMPDFTPLDQALQAAAGNVNFYRARIRAQLQLDVQQQQVLTEHIWGRLSTLQDRCRIYSLVKQLE